MRHCYERCLPLLCHPPHSPMYGPQQTPPMRSHPACACALASSVRDAPQSSIVGGTCASGSAGRCVSDKLRLEIVYAVERRHLAEAHWEPAIPPVHADHAARREVLGVDFLCGPRELVSFDTTGPDAARAESRLLVIRLRWPSTEWAADWAVQDQGVAGDLSLTLPHSPGHNLTNPECLLAGRARPQLHRRQRRLCHGPHEELLLDAALPLNMAVAVERCVAARQAAADSPHIGCRQWQFPHIHRRSPLRMSSCFLRCT